MTSTHFGQEMKILIDTQEPPWILTQIKAHPFFVSSEIEVAKLDCGDIWIDDIIIERKTISDLLTSIKDKRLSNQAAEMRASSEWCYLLIEGPLTWIEQKIIGTGWHFRSIQGALLQVQEFGVLVVHAADEADVPATLAWLASRDRSKIVPLAPRKYGVEWTPGEEIISGIPNLSQSKASQLLNHYGSAAKAFEGLCNGTDLPAGFGPKTRENTRYALGLSDNQRLEIKDGNT